MANKTPNVVLRINYYCPSYREKRNQTKRDFYASKNKDDYIGYVNKGIKEGVPQDYIEYLDNNKKTNGIFNKDGLMSKEGIAELRKDLRKTESVIWDGIISFKEEFGKKWCDNYEQAFNLMKNEMPKFFKKNNLDPENIEWFAGLHINTDNRHIHFCFFEKEATRYRKKENKFKYSHGKLNKNSLANFKANIESFLTNTNSKIFKARQGLANSVRDGLSQNIDKDIHSKLVKLSHQLPPTGRLTYDSEDMMILRPKVDNLTEMILTRNADIKNEFENYLSAIKDKEMIVNSYIKRNKIDMEKQDFNEKYVKDIYRRIGNLIITQARKLKDDDTNFKQMKVVNKKYKYYKKNNLMDEIIKTLEFSERCNQEAIWAFRNHMYELNKFKYERERENAKGYEM